MHEVRCKKVCIKFPGIVDHADTEQCLEGHMIVERNSIQVSIGLYNLFEHCSVYMSSNTWKFDANSFAPYYIHTKECV